ncbi:649_t:CDS:2 [Entrophospora sp. SA101]|nr:649_t:CDS:2 [Entrophospora sp. SA101]
MSKVSSALAHTPFKTEYAVEMTCESCVKTINNVLKNIPGIDNFDIDLQEQKVIVEGTDTGKTVIVRGQGTINGSHAGAAPRGLARLVQIDNDICLIDITVQGLTPGYHGIHIHELGDISNGPLSTGDHYNPENVEHGDINIGHIGDLGNIYVDESGWGDLVVESRRIKVWEIIGRSIVISHGKDDEGKGNDKQSKIDGNSGQGLIAGIIARSAGAFENTKKVCSCSGKTLWEEARLDI